MLLLHFLLFIRIEVHLKIQFNDIIQIENVGTSTFLAIGPPKENSTNSFDLFTTNSQDNADFYWEITSAQSQDENIKCNSIISIMDPKNSNYISAFLFFDNNYVIISKDAENAQCLWNITCLNDGDKFWIRGKPVQFKNLEHNCYLSTSLESPTSTFFPNRWRLNCISESKKNSFWKAEKGLFFERKEHLT